MAARGIILDLDATLVDSESAYARALRWIGIDPEGAAFQNARAAVKRRLGEGHVSARNRLLYFKEMLLSEGHYTPSALLELMDRYEQKLAAIFTEDWTRLGRDELMRAISLRAKVVLLTNENLRTQTLKLRAIDPQGRWFPKVLTSEELGAEKPAADAFRAAITVLGVEPLDCVAVGDRFAADLKPALDLGCQAVLTTEFCQWNETVDPRVKVISDLNALRELWP